jgi:protein-L-isoaspartate(D-aspartate) O-methyltransferase
VRFGRELARIGVDDPAVLRAMADVDRALFVPAEHRDEAGVNAPIPIGHGQTISAPDVVGYMTQALRVKAGAKVLDVGTGSGYQAAILAAMGCRVFSVEIVPELARAAASRLAGVEVRIGDGNLGWPEEAPFDGIVVAAAARAVPPALVDQLRPGARLVIPVGPAGGVQVLRIVGKASDGRVSSEDTLQVRFVPLVATSPRPSAAGTPLPGSGRRP